MRRIGAYSCAAILLLAFGLRAYHLSFQASMSDDALGLMLARRNPLELFSLTATEPFPPTFYVTLSLWTKLAGDTEYAGRFFSLLFSLASLGVMYRAGRRWLGERTGLIAAFLLAINPLDIYFAQEVRMYTMLTLFSLLSSVFAFELIAERSNRWLAYGLASLLAVMTHAFALLVLFAQAVAALLAGPRHWRWLRSWAAAQLGVVVVFGLWAGLVVGNLEAYRNALVSAPSLWGGLWRGFSTFAFGFSPATGVSRALPALLVALMAVGACWLMARAFGRAPCAPRTAAFLLSYLLLPFVIVWAVSLAKPVFYERYMVICLPPALLLAATGITALENGLRGAEVTRIGGAALAAASMLAVAVTSGLHLRGYYQTVVYASSNDMRQLSSYVASAANPVVVTNVAEGDPLYGYYLPPSLPVASTLEMANPATSLQQLASQYDVIWFLPFGNSDRQRAASDWLNANAYPGVSRWFGNAQVLAFASPAAGGQGAAMGSGANFGGQIQLSGVTAPGQLAAGEPVDVTLHWQARARPAKDYSVFVHLLDSSGATVSQHDGWPAGGSQPTSSWQAGQTIDDRHALLTTRGLPAGRYQLEVGLYDAAGQRLTMADGRSSTLAGSLEVTSLPSAGQ
ncbi:MAG TPA: glycosyltransferase family 39 protein [Chloroflexota bacterium]|nr:glycosyltransferase family 39 protein [Chloroflexota bacterium]